MIWDLGECNFRDMEMDYMNKKYRLRKSKRERERYSMALL
jgi:hypothetical protein